MMKRVSVYLLGLSMLFAVSMALKGGETTASSLDDVLMLDIDQALGTAAGGAATTAAAADGTPLPILLDDENAFLCAPGQKRRSGETPCIDCPIGFVSRTHDADACVPCPDGETTLTVGAFECVPQLVQAA
jgi:hypothetical protein